MNSLRLLDSARWAGALIGLIILSALPAKAALSMDEHQIFSHLKANRLEYESNGKLQLFKWDVQHWVGTDTHKLWLKTEGDYAGDQGIFGRADLQLLYSRNISTFWDLQIGARKAFEPERTFDAVIGFQGLAPYFFEVDGALFITNNGKVLGRLDLEYEALITQRLIFQPRIEINVSASDINNRGVKAGIAEFEVGARLRYEIEREFAPYLGFDYVEEESLLEHQHGVRFVVGMRLWY